MFCAAFGGVRGEGQRRHGRAEASHENCSASCAHAEEPPDPESNSNRPQSVTLRARASEDGVGTNAASGNDDAVDEARKEAHADTTSHQVDGASTAASTAPPAETVAMEVDNPPPAAPDNPPGLVSDAESASTISAEACDDMSDLSEASDLSDVFHVAVDESKSWTTPEDDDQERARSLAAALRAKPLLPPHPSDPHESWTDVSSGLKFPRIHCAVRGCPWTHDEKQREQEDVLLEHLLQHHRQLLERCCGPQDTQNDYLAYYCYAIRLREREAIPSIGVSIDRRTFGHLVEGYNSDRVRSLVCVCCAQIHTDTGDPASTEISMTTGREQVFNALMPYKDDDDALKERKRCCLELNFGLDNFKQRYGYGPLKDAPEFEKGESEWQQTLDIAPKKRRLATKTAAESQHPFDHSAPRNFEIICCPEDVECDAHERGSIICGKCRVPVCRTCRRKPKTRT